MSTHKRFDLLCVLVIITALLCAGFMLLSISQDEEKAATLETSKANDASLYSEEDNDESFIESEASVITLKNDSYEITGQGAQHSGNDIYITKEGTYVISGEAKDCTINVLAEKKDTVRIILNGVSINNESMPVLYVQKAKKLILTLAKNSDNTLVNGRLSDNEKLDGVIYSKSDVTINGSGNLTISTDYKNGIVSKDTIKICGGNIEILKCYEGIEADKIYVNGGNIVINPTDDGINARDEKEGLFQMDGGELSINNPNGIDADGIDSNKDIVINDGKITVYLNGNGPNCALDYGSENGGKCEINGGDVNAEGGCVLMEEERRRFPGGFNGPPQNKHF